MTATPPALPTLGVLLPRDLPTDLVLPYARRAEEVGLAEIWVVEDLGFRGGIAQAAAVLGATERIVVGIGILPAAARNEVFGAMELATLAQLHPGRLVVGLGHGMPDWLRRVGAWPARPLHRLATTTTTTRDLLRGLPVVNVGRDGEHREWRLEPSALPDVVPPVVLGVRGPRSIALAGTIADGLVLAEPVTPEYVRAAREQAGRPAGDDWIVAGYLPAAIVPAGPDGPDGLDGGAAAEAAAVAAVRPGLAWVGEPDWAPHLAPLPFADRIAELRAEVGQEGFAAALPAEWVRQLALAGSPEAVRARLAELAAAGLTTAVLMPTGPDPMAALDAFALLLDQES